MAKPTTKSRGFGGSNVGQGVTMAKAKEPEKDPAYIALGKILGQIRIDPEASKNEAKRIHKDRSTRKLASGTNVTGQAIRRAGTADSARRSRLVELRNDLLDARNNVAAVYDKVYTHVSTVYGKTHFSEFRSMADRQAAIYNMPNFVAAGDFMSVADSVIEVIKYAIEDIDQSGFTLNLAMRTLELGARGKDF